jgi:pimeloyl-ACP methyl ester carboxylesterase
MKHPKLVILGATALGLGAAAAGAYRATHPKDAHGPLSPDPGRRRPPVPDALFDLPAGVIEHEIPTPDGGTVHAVEKGEGRPLVLLHGITLRADVWAPQFHQLADHHRVIAVDLRGHGTSRAGEAGYGIGRLGDDLATLLTALDLHHAVLVGHSMGGMTVMQFCGDHPDVLAERSSSSPPAPTRSSRRTSTVGRASWSAAASRSSTPASRSHRGRRSPRRRLASPSATTPRPGRSGSWPRWASPWPPRRWCRRWAA